MRSLVRRLDPWFELYMRGSLLAVSWIAGLALCVAVGVNAYNVVLRYGWRTGIVWHQEVALLSAFVVYFLAYGLIAKREGYIRIEAFVLLLPPSALRWLMLFNRIVVIGFHVIIFVLCLSAIDLVRIESTFILEMPEMVYFFPLALGAVDIVMTEIILLLRALWGDTRAAAPHPGGL